VEQPQPRRVQVDAEFARFTAPPRGTAFENVLQQRVQELMHARIDREERYLVAMRVVQRDHAQVVSTIPGGHTAQGPAVVPFDRNPITDDEVDHARIESSDFRLPSGVPPNLTCPQTALKANAARCEVPHCLRPDVRPEEVKLFRPPLRLAVQHKVNRHDEGRLRDCWNRSRARRRCDR